MTYKRLIMTRGLPGSGKSTWAAAEAARLEGQGVKVYISNKDGIRKALARAGWTWSQDGEKQVIQTQNAEIKGAFAHGCTVVIVADTNFGKHEARMRGLAQQSKADFEVKDFTHVPVETCIERDAQRKDSVGAEVIKEMYYKYVAAEDYKPYVPDTSKNPAIICDLDGTLALHNGKRSPYEYSKVGEDTVNEPIASIVRHFANGSGAEILYVSGREDWCQSLTEGWLRDNKLPVGKLFMRPTKDQRKDYIVKKELFDKFIRNEYNVRFVLDDRNQVVAMWRRLGLTCLQVADGAF